MKKISRIVGLAAVLAAVMFTACAPVADTGEWKSPIGSTTVKPAEMNKTPLTAQGLERLLQGWWNNGSEGIFFTVDGGVKKGYKKGGTMIPVSASVRATIGEGILYDHEEFTWEVTTGGKIILTIKKPTGGADAIATKHDAGYNYDYYYKDRAGAHADGTVLYLNYDFAKRWVYETYGGTVKGYDYDYANSDEMDVMVGYGNGYGPTATMADRNGNNARNMDRYVARFKYTAVTKSGTGATATYAMGTAEYVLDIVDLDEDIKKLNALLARGYGIEEFEIPVAFDPDPKIKLMTVSIYNSKEGKVKEYKNIAYTKRADTTASRIIFTVNDIDYELTMPTAATGTGAEAGGKLTRWYKGSATTGTTVALPLPTANTQATYTAADYNENATAPGIPAVTAGGAADDGKGKIALKEITADDKTGAFFIFKMEDKYVGRIKVEDAISRSAGTANAITASNAATGAALRAVFTKPGTTPAQLVIGDKTTTSYDPQYSVYKPYYDFTWIVDGDTTTQIPDGNDVTTLKAGTAGDPHVSVVLNGKFTPHKATFQFFYSSDDIMKDGVHMGHATAKVGWLTDGENGGKITTANGYAKAGATDDAFDETAMNYGFTSTTTAGTTYDLPPNGAYQSFEVEIKDLANGMKMADIIKKYGTDTGILKTPADITIGDMVYKFKGWSDWYNNGKYADGITDITGTTPHSATNIVDRYQGWQNVGDATNRYDENLPADVVEVKGTANNVLPYVNSTKPLSTEKYTAFQSDGTNNPSAPFQIGYSATRTPTAPVPTDDNVTVRLFAQYERKGVYAYFYKANRALDDGAGTPADSYDLVNPAAKVLVETSMVAQRTAAALEKNKPVAELYNGTPVADIPGTTPHTFIGAWSATPSINPPATAGGAPVRSAANPGPGYPAIDLTYADVYQRTLAQGKHEFYASYMTGDKITLTQGANTATTLGTIYVPNVTTTTGGGTTMATILRPAIIVNNAAATGLPAHAQLTINNLGRYLGVQDNPPGGGGNSPNYYTPWFDIVASAGTFNGTVATTGTPPSVTAVIKLNDAGEKVFKLAPASGTVTNANELRYDGVTVTLQ